MSVVIKSQANIPSINFTPFNNYLNSLSGSIHGVTITFSRTALSQDRMLYNYTITADTRELASDVEEKIKDGVFYHGG